MGVVELSLLKKHVRADDFTSDDALLQSYLDAAEEQVVRYTHRTVAELLELGGGKFPAMLVQAVLLLAGGYYANAESVSTVQMFEVPWGVSALLKPYRKLSGDESGPSEV